MTAPVAIGELAQLHQQALAELGFAVPNYFGGCPHCGTINFLNIGREHWGCCHTHRTKWQLGANLFSNWCDETEQVWERNKQTLADYDLVKSLPPTDPDYYADGDRYRATWNRVLEQLRERRRLIASITEATA